MKEDSGTYRSTAHNQGFNITYSQRPLPAVRQHERVPTESRAPGSPTEALKESDGSSSFNNAARAKKAGQIPVCLVKV